MNPPARRGDGTESELCRQPHLEPGSSPLVPSLEEDFITWREQFWPAVCEHLGVEATGDESR